MKYNYSTITDIHCEPTQKCQASCLMCDRNKNGGEENQYLTNADLTLEQFKNIFKPEFIKQLQKFYFCGNHGDPILCPDLLEMCIYLRENNKNLNLSIITNGGARTTEWWSKLAPVVSNVQFSVDGLWDTNHIYRQGVSWPRVEENMWAFTSSGGTAHWTFLIFKYNQHQIEEAEKFATLMGVKKFQVKKSGRYVKAVDLKKREVHTGTNRKGDQILLEQPTHPKYQNTAVSTDYDNIVEKFGSMDAFIEVADIAPKCVTKQEVYVSAEGLVFPCCWTHGQVYKWFRPFAECQEGDLIASVGGFSEINANKKSLQSIVDGEFFSSIKKTWNIKGCENGRLRTCATKCNVGFDPYTAQWEK